MTPGTPPNAFVCTTKVAVPKRPACRVDKTRAHAEQSSTSFFFPCPGLCCHLAHGFVSPAICVLRIRYDREDHVLGCLRRHRHPCDRGGRRRDEHARRRTLGGGLRLRGRRWASQGAVGFGLIAGVIFNTPLPYDGGVVWYAAGLCLVCA